MPGVQLTNTNGALDSVNFGSPPTCSVAPTTDSQLANKQYVDDSVEAINVANSTFSQPILQIMLTANASNKSNTALGEYSLPNYYSNDIGRNNTAVGVNSLGSNTSGKDNTSIGYQSLTSNIEGDDNTAIGVSALHSSTNSYYNTAVGKNSLITLRNGANFNTAIGYDSGGNNVTWNGSAYGNTFLGAGTYMTSNFTFSTAVGATAAITKSNQIVLGTSSQTVTIPKFTTAGVVHNSAQGDLTSSLIVTADISNNAITSAKIADDAITSAKIADGSITTAKIATGAITSEKILDGTIVGSDISSNTITADNIANGTITSAKIGTGVIVGSNIAEATITSNNLISNLDLSGNPTTTTQSSNDNSTRIATTAFVKNQNYITSSSLGVMNLSAPASPVDGSFYFDITSGNFRIYYSGAWKDFAQIA